MRKWVLAAVAALAVGQAEARTYVLKISGDLQPITEPGNYQATAFSMFVEFDPDQGRLEEGTDFVDRSGDLWLGLLGPVTRLSYEFSGLRGKISPTFDSYLTLYSYAQQTSQQPYLQIYGSNFAQSIPDKWQRIGLEISDPRLMSVDFRKRISLSGVSGNAIFNTDDQTNPPLSYGGGWFYSADLEISPVPLPASACLLFGALAGLGALRRVRAAELRSAT